MLDNLQEIRAQSSRFGATLTGADLSAPVPSCPEWTIRDLAEHLGGVQRFWADDVTAGNPDRPPRSGGSAPPDVGDLVAWMGEGTDRLLAALGQTSTEAPCWTWWGAPRTCGAVARHQVHEAAVHRWDLENALGSAAPLASAVADDGVSEFLEIVVGSATNTLLGSVSLRADDTGGEWILGDQRGPHAVVRASASDLVLLLYGRLPATGVDVEGDADLLDELLDLVDTD